MPQRPPLPRLQASDLTSAFPRSNKVYVEQRGARVPMREISLTNRETLRVYDCSCPQGGDAREGLPKLRSAWVAARRGTANVTQLHYARRGEVTPEMEFVA